MAFSTHNWIKFLATILLLSNSFTFAQTDESAESTESPHAEIWIREPQVAATPGMSPSQQPSTIETRSDPHTSSVISASIFPRRPTKTSSTRTTTPIPYSSRTQGLQDLSIFTSTKSDPFEGEDITPEETTSDPLNSFNYISTVHPTTQSSASLVTVTESASASASIYVSPLQTNGSVSLVTAISSSSSTPNVYIINNGGVIPIINGDGNLVHYDLDDLSISLANLTAMLVPTTTVPASTTEAPPPPPSSSSSEYISVPTTVMTPPPESSSSEYTPPPIIAPITDTIPPSPIENIPTTTNCVPITVTITDCPSCPAPQTVYITKYVPTTSYVPTTFTVTDTRQVITTASFSTTQTPGHQYDTARYGEY